MVVNGGQETVAQFPGMDPAEQFQFYFLRHPLRLWKSMALAAFWFLLACALFYISDAWATEDQTMARATATIISLIVVVSQINFLLRFYADHLRIVIVTDRKIHQFKRTLMTMDRQESTDLATLQDMDKLQRSIIQSMLGFGTLKLEAPTAQVRIHFTPRINEMYGRIIGLREEARRSLQLPTEPIKEEIDS